MLTDIQMSNLRAAMDRVIPADDFPGAWDAGVGDYLARQWQGDLKHLIGSYQAFLDLLEAEALRTQGLSFFKLSPELQDALLKKAPAFLDAFVQHVMEGYYADPGNGGNRDYVSWKMLGYREGHRGP
jgi:gluconate 2-dehydrogenase gamma chain